jgi:hypothetical protein
MKLEEHWNNGDVKLLSIFVQARVLVEIIVGSGSCRESSWQWGDWTKRGVVFIFVLVLMVLLLCREIGKLWSWSCRVYHGSVKKMKYVCCRLLGLVESYYWLFIHSRVVLELIMTEGVGRGYCWQWWRRDFLCCFMMIM